MLAIVSPDSIGRLLAPALTFLLHVFCIAAPKNFSSNAFCVLSARRTDLPHHQDISQLSTRSHSEQRLHDGSTGMFSDYEQCLQ